MNREKKAAGLGQFLRLLGGVMLGIAGAVGALVTMMQGDTGGGVAVFLGGCLAASILIGET